MRWFSRWLIRRADETLRRENERLEAVAASLRIDLEEAKAKLKVQEAELQELSAVVARNIKRVEAETAAAARQIADAERGRQWPLNT